MPFERTQLSGPLAASDRADLMRRAVTAWHKEGAPAPAEALDHPVTARVASKVTKAAQAATPSGEAPNPLHFVVVHAGGALLAVYRVRVVNGAFMLRKMARPPKDLVRLQG